MQPLNSTKTEEQQKDTQSETELSFGVDLAAEGADRTVTAMMYGDEAGPKSATERMIHPSSEQLGQLHALVMALAEANLKLLKQNQELSTMLSQSLDQFERLHDSIKPLLDSVKS